MPTERFWPLARVWYVGRLDLDYTPRSREAQQALLAEHGFTGPFWALDGGNAPTP
ncbi:MAG: hypothetical protein KC645_04160 [Gemmatimonadetes bacterium]|nr:hypothetical protein [Gemmatimonadota bacterium]